MKKLIFVLIGVFTLLNTACLPDKCCVPPKSEIYLFARKDAVQWFANPSGSKIQNDTITITGAGQYPGSFRDSLGIQIKYTGPGNYKLLKNQVFYYSTPGHSAPVSSYKIDSLYDNSINISYYDQGDNLINGTFNLKFIDFNAPSGNPKDISFLDGRFNVPLHK